MFCDNLSVRFVSTLQLNCPSITHQQYKQYWQCVCQKAVKNFHFKLNILFLLEIILIQRIGLELFIHTTGASLSGLVNYWPFNGSTKDIIGGKDITIQSNGVLYFDRFNNTNSAIRFTLGYGSFPSGNYFDPTAGFTIMAWFNILVAPGLYVRLSKNN